MRVVLDSSLAGDLTCASHSANSRLRIHTIGGRRRYERWSDEERERILAESFMPGRSVSQVARDNGVGLGLLHYWRRQARAVGAVEEMRFVPVSLASTATSPAPRTAVPTNATGALELVIRDVTVRVSGAVDVESLRNVLAAIRG